MQENIAYNLENIGFNPERGEKKNPNNTKPELKPKHDPTLTLMQSTFFFFNGPAR